MGMNIRISAALTALSLALTSGISFAADPRIEQGAIFEAKGDYEMALGEYRALLAEQPQNSEAYFLAAEVYMKKSKPDYSRALANYRLAYKFTPSMSKAYEGAAKVYEVLGQKAKAEAERAKDPKNRPVEAASSAGAAEAAPAQEPATMAESPKPAEPAAVANASEAKPAEPAQASSAPKSEPAKTEEPSKKAEEVKQAEQKSAAKAEEPVKKAEAAQAEPAKPVEQKSAELPSDPFEKGKVLFAEGKYKEAAPLWREVLAKKPGHAGAYFFAGLTRYELGEYDKAEINLKKGLSYKERGNDANYYLALVYQKTRRIDAEKKALAAYLKKAAPDAQYRSPAEARLAEMKASADSAKVAGEALADTAPVAEGTATKTVAAAESVKAAPEAKPAETAEQASFSGAPTIANANLLFKARSFEAALQMYKSLLDTELNQDERYFVTLQMGNVYRELRDFHSAVTRYRTVVQQYPESDWATEAERALEDAVWLEKHASELPRVTR